MTSFQGLEMLMRQEQIRGYLLSFLKKAGPSTTAEIIQHAPTEGEDCDDRTRARIMSLLLTLEDEKIVEKAISSEKNALVWSLVS